MESKDNASVEIAYQGKTLFVTSYREDTAIPGNYVLFCETVFGRRLVVESRYIGYFDVSMLSQLPREDL